MRMAENSINRYVLRDDGILVAYELNPEIERTPELATETLDFLEDFLGGDPHPALWDVRPVLRFSATEWRQIVDRLEDLVSVLALVIDEQTPGAQSLFPVLRFLPDLQMRTFSNEEDALDWLRSQTR